MYYYKMLIDDDYTKIVQTCILMFLYYKVLFSHELHMIICNKLQLI